MNTSEFIPGSMSLCKYGSRGHSLLLIRQTINLQRIWGNKQKIPTMMQQRFEAMQHRYNIRCSAIPYLKILAQQT